MTPTGGLSTALGREKGGERAGEGGHVAEAEETEGSAPPQRKATAMQQNFGECSEESHWGVQHSVKERGDEHKGEHIQQTERSAQLERNVTETQQNSQNGRESRPPPCKSRGSNLVDASAARIGGGDWPQDLLGGITARCSITS